MVDGGKRKEAIEKRALSLNGENTKFVHAHLMIYFPDCML